MTRKAMLSFISLSVFSLSPAVGRAQEATAAEPQPAASPDPCANIGCSGHGKCAVLDGRPTCSCDDGYRADPANGLGCLPLSAVQVTPQSQPPAEEESELQQVEKMVGGIDLASHYSDYLENRKGADSFLDYEKEKYRRKKIKNAVLIMFGSIFIPVGIGLFVADLADPDTDPELVAFGATFLVAGVAMLIPSAIMLHKNRKISKRLEVLGAPGGVAFRF